MLQLARYFNLNPASNTEMTSPAFIIVSIAGLIFGLLFILTALRLLSQEKVVFHSLLYMALGLVISISMVLAYIEGFTPLSSEIYNLIAEATLLALVLTFGALTLDFLKKSPRSILNYWVVAALVLTLWGLLTFDVKGWGQLAAAWLGSGPLQSAPMLISALGWVIGLTTALIVVARDFRQPHTTQYLNRLRYWVIVTALLIVTGTILFLSPAIFDIAGLILLTGASLLAGSLILSYHTPDLRLLIGQATRYLGVTTVLFLIYLLSMLLVIIIRQTPGSAHAAVFWAVILAIILANISNPLWRVSRQFLTRLIFGKQQKDERQVIRHYSRSISAALDMNRLSDTMINLMIETLGIEHGIVFAGQRTRSGDLALRPLSSVGLDGLMINPGTVSATSPFLDKFRQGKKILSQYDIDVLPEFRLMGTEEKAWLAELKMEMYVPILRERELIGLIGLGQQGQNAAYYEEDHDLLIALADQAALAMDSARLFEQLAVINQEVGTLTNKLAGLDQGKADFLSIASHELRTPLTHIHGYSRMLLDLTEEELSDPTYVKTLIEGIAKGSERMKGVIDVMFDVTEADVGEMNLFTGEVILEEVLEMATRPFLAALDERRIAFGKQGIKDLPPIEADGTRLVQALENLIGNAVKFTPDGGRVMVEGRCVVDETLGSCIEIMVIDTGIGIDPHYHTTIFEKFFRIDEAEHHSTGKTKFKGAGPGLGLTLVKAIADAHGGKVWVESIGEDELNLPGSKFFLIIPVKQPDEAKFVPPKQSQIETRHWRVSELQQPAKNIPPEMPGGE